MQWPAFDWAARNTEMAALLIGFLVALCFAPHIESFQHRDDILRQTYGWLPARVTLEALEYRLYDERFSSRGPTSPEARSSIAIIAVDQTSLTRVGQWPWPRSMHARLIKRLDKAGARVIALDFDFSDRQNPAADGSLSPADIALINETRSAGNVIYPSLYDIELRQSGSRQKLVSHLASPFTENEKGMGLDEQTPDLGLAYLPLDSDGGYRRYPYSAIISGANVGGFAVLACALHQKLVAPVNSFEGRTWKTAAYEHALRAKIWPEVGGGSRPVPARTVSLGKGDDDSFSNVLINYTGPSGTYSTYSYADVLYSWTDDQVAKRFKDRIVFVGPTAVILKDVFPFPLFEGRNIRLGKEQKIERNTIAGVEIHATVASMLLEGNYIKPPSNTTMWWSLFGLTMFSAVWTEIVREHISRVARRIQGRWHKCRLFKRFRIRIQDAVWFGLYGLVAMVPATAYWGVCVYLFVETNRWIVAAYPLVSSGLASAMVLVFLFTVESSERRKVIHQVGLYMDRDIMEEILSHPEEEYPRPRRTVATVMFTDLEGFTSFAESHDAGEVVAALNDFMTRMKPIIRRYGGTVDKYIGDAIMAYFGVPLERHDHAERALICAIELQEECVRFREETGVNFRMRVGLHTGELIAGSVGSAGSDEDQPYMNYTVIGDTVNLASRLEGKNKEFGSWIMCSRATFEAAPGIAEVIPASTSIKGKSQDVEVFIVRGFEGQEPRDTMWAQLNPDGTSHPELNQRSDGVLSAGGENEEEAPIAPLALSAGPDKE